MDGELILSVKAHLEGTALQEVTENTERSAMASSLCDCRAILFGFCNSTALLLLQEDAFLTRHGLLVG